MSKFNIALSFATEDSLLVEKVYRYLKAEGLSVFFAPSPDGQAILSGKNQREVFYSIFGLESEYVALFVSKHYLEREVPMEEANIALSKHAGDGHVLPIYLDGTHLPYDMFDPKKDNYYRSNNPAHIADHIAKKLKPQSQQGHPEPNSNLGSRMIIKGNIADKQTFVQNLNGSMKT